jgi:hypothetical protein
MKTSVSPVFSFDELPLVLNANQVASVLNISRTNAYALFHRRDFPTLQIGGRMLVARDKLIQWMDDQVMAQ